MAPSTRRAVVPALAGVACLGAWSATRSFVGAGAPASGSTHLRRQGAAAEQLAPQAAPSRGSSRGIWAGASAASLLAAGAAAARRASAATRRAAEGKEVAEATIPRPEDLLESPKFPLYMGSTGGYMSASTRERHAITWTSKAEELFEMPTGGEAIMNKGENLCYFRKKEQCIALGKQLRQMKIENYKIYRIAKDGTVTFMHPADGVFPEKVNKGRVQVNGRPFTVAQNPNPGQLKWTKYHMKSYEADPLTTMFVKARIAAFEDMENLFPLPNPSTWVSEEEGPEVWKKIHLEAAEKCEAQKSL